MIYLKTSLFSIPLTISLCLFCLLCCRLLLFRLPAAPAAASELPSLSLVGAAAAAACIAAHRSSSPLVRVLASRSAPSLSRWQLAGEPERRRWRNGSGRRGRRLPRCRGLFLDWRRGWHNRLQSRSLVCRFAFLDAAGQVRHQLNGGDPAGIGGQMDPVTGPDARPVNGGQVLRWGLARTKEAKKVY